MSPYTIENLALGIAKAAHDNNVNIQHDIGLHLAEIAANAADTWVNYTGEYLNHISYHKLRVIIGNALVEAITPR